MNRESSGGLGEEAEVFHFSTEQAARQEVLDEIARLEAIINTDPDSKARERWQLQVKALKNSIGLDNESGTSIN